MSSAGPAFDAFLAQCALTQSDFLSLSVQDRVEIVSKFRCSDHKALPTPSNPSPTKADIVLPPVSTKGQAPPLLRPAFSLAVPIRTKEEEHSFLRDQAVVQGLGDRLTAPVLTRLRVSFPSQEFQAPFLELLTKEDRLFLRRVFHHSTAHPAGREMTLHEVFEIILCGKVLRKYDAFLKRSLVSGGDCLSGQTIRKSFYGMCVCVCVCVCVVLCCVCMRVQVWLCVYARARGVSCPISAGACFSWPSAHPEAGGWCLPQRLCTRDQTVS